jgi:hypothetical protein
MPISFSTAILEKIFIEIASENPSLLVGFSRGMKDALAKRQAFFRYVLQFNIYTAIMCVWDKNIEERRQQYH